MRLLLSVLLCSIVSSSWCQDYSFIHYTVAEGMPSAEVYECFQDKNGFVWFATDNGVARFDGTEIQSFHARQGLPDPVVFGFQEDHKGRIWFRSYSGRLSWFENGTIYKHPYNDTIALLCRKSILHSIYVDSTDRVWLGAGEFSGSLTVDGKMNIEYTPEYQVYFKTIKTGFIVGLYWPSSLVNTIRIDGKTFSINQPDRNYDNQTVRAARWNGDIYFSMANSIYRYDGRSITRAFHSTDHIISISVDKENQMWVGFRESGVNCFKDSRFENPVAINFLKDKAVSSVLEDDQKGYWFSTLQNGVYYIPNLSFRNYATPNGIKIISAKRQGNQTILGDENGTLTYVDNHSVVSKQIARLPGKTLFTLFVDSRKNIWASTIRESYLMDSTLSVKKTLRIHNDFFERQDTVFGLSRVRLLKYSMQGEVVQSLPLATIHRSMLNCPPFVLMSARTGLEVFDSQFRFIKTVEAFKDFKISKLINLNDSLVLVSTIGTGYFLIRKKTWEIISRSEGKNFIGDNVYTSVMVDSSLWFGTEKGIAITSVRGLIHNSPAYSFIDEQSGLISNKINLLTYAPPNVWAFTDQGLTLLPKDISSYTSPAPRFYLKNMLINDKEADLLKEKQLAFLRNNIQINFGFISFKNQHIRLRSRLAQNGEWHYSEDRSLKFYSLAPGNYNFQLQYSADMVHWINALDEIPFAILQPWWRTSWFQAIIIASIILVLYVIFGSQMTVLKHRNERLNALNENKKNLLQAEIETLERERSRIAKDLHDGVGMNLTVLKLHLHELLKKYHEPDSFQMEEQLKSTIQEIRAIVHNLTPSGIALFGLAEAVKDYIDRTTAHLSVQVEVFSAGKKIMDPKISLFSFRIIQELLSNSLKHSYAKRITLRINGLDSSLNIIFQDDGIGFDPARCKYGSGLMNIQSRLEAIEGTLEFSSSGSGVLYILNIPIKGEKKLTADPMLRTG